ncbi:helix-turn-helix transcriptional regulator [Hathewaya massiliensis]|uniref:helix-turn-helix transcriptional regulator n=1 Tax=Hathewaya massiliensis TaxID=1964382 RepID=UPI0011581784|nr:helix-turn-helix transcriptional regulator [Hathewaya massiliensis]
MYANLPENTIGKRIYKSRIKRNLSQKELSVLCNISRGAINMYENDYKHPSRIALYKLGTVLDLEYLCDDYAKLLLSNYADKLKNWRIKNNFSMRKAAKVLEVAPTTYISWENGLYDIGINNYNKIKEKLLDILKEP